MIYYGTASGRTEEEDEDDDRGERHHNSRLICYLDQGIRGAQIADSAEFFFFKWVYAKYGVHMEFVKKGGCTLIRNVR